MSRRWQAIGRWPPASSIFCSGWLAAVKQELLSLGGKAIFLTISAPLWRPNYRPHDASKLASERVGSPRASVFAASESAVSYLLPQEQSRRANKNDHQSIGKREWTFFSGRQKKWQLKWRTDRKWVAAARSLWAKHEHTCLGQQKI